VFARLPSALRLEARAEERYSCGRWIRGRVIRQLLGRINRIELATLFNVLKAVVPHSAGGPEGIWFLRVNSLWESFDSGRGRCWEPNRETPGKRIIGPVRGWPCLCRRRRSTAVTRPSGRWTSKGGETLTCGSSALSSRVSLLMHVWSCWALPQTELRYTNRNFHLWMFPVPCTTRQNVFMCSAATGQHSCTPENRLVRLASNAFNNPIPKVAQGSPVESFWRGPRRFRSTLYPLLRTTRACYFPPRKKSAKEQRREWYHMFPPKYLLVQPRAENVNFRHIKYECSDASRTELQVCWIYALRYPMNSCRWMEPTHRRSCQYLLSGHDEALCTRTCTGRGPHTLRIPYA